MGDRTRSLIACAEAEADEDDALSGAEGRPAVGRERSVEHDTVSRCEIAFEVAVGVDEDGAAHGGGRGEALVLEAQDQVGLPEAEFGNVEVKELSLLQVGDVDAVVRLTAGSARTRARSGYG